MLLYTVPKTGPIFEAFMGASHLEDKIPNNFGKYSAFLIITGKFPLQVTCSHVHSET
jgi:hypothetical protein